MRGSLIILGVDPYPEGFSLVIKPGRPPRKELCPEGSSWKGGGGDGKNDSTAGRGRRAPDARGAGGAGEVGSNGVEPKGGAGGAKGAAAPAAQADVEANGGVKPKVGAKPAVKPPAQAAAKAIPKAAAKLPSKTLPRPSFVAVQARQAAGVAGTRPPADESKASTAAADVGLPPVTSSSVVVSSTEAPANVKLLKPVAKNEVKKPCEGCVDPVKDEIPSLSSRRRRRR